ncbi:MAG: hypothetical protein U1D55_05290 [Phycisphaerae bacterium]
MTARIGIGLLVVAGLTVCIVCFVAPVGVSVWEALRDGDWALAAMSTRRGALIARGILISCGAVFFAIVLGACLSCGLLHRSRTLATISRIAALTTILSPPYVIAYSFGLPLLPEGLRVAATQAASPDWLVGEARAIACLALWTAPIAALILSTGWRASGAPAMSLARLDGGGPAALRRAALPAVWPWLALAAIACGLVSMGEFSVCHLCLVQIWNTEVLAEVQLLGKPGQALLLAWPLAAILGLVSAAAWPLRAKVRTLLLELSGLGDARDAAPPMQVGGPGAALTALAALLILASPWAVLLVNLRRPGALATAWVTYAGDWRDGVATAIGSTLACAAASLSLAYVCGSRIRDKGRWRRGIAIVTVSAAFLLAFSPPTLVGDAVAALLELVPAMRDGAWGVIIVGVARYGVVPIVTMWLALGISGGSVDDLARSEADWPTQFRRVRVPLAMPAWLGSCAIAGVLSLTEVAASQLVRAPGVGSVALTLLNQIHFGRNDEIIAMSLQVFVVTAGMSILVGKGLRD